MANERLQAMVSFLSLIPETFRNAQTDGRSQAGGDLSPARLEQSSLVCTRIDFEGKEAWRICD